MYPQDGQLLYCLLLKALYCLKQGGRQWYLKLSKVLNVSEKCTVIHVPMWGDSTGGKVVVPTNMDDCHVIGKRKV